MTVGGAFSNADHLRPLSEERRDGKKERDAAYKSKLEGLLIDLKGTHKLLLLSTKSTGAWLSIRGTTVSDTVLSGMEFRDFLCARYNVSPLNLQSHCDKCGTSFGVMHTHSYSIGSLVIAHHNEICDELHYLSRRAFTSASVRAKPLIHQGRTRSEQEIRQGSDKDKETWGDLMVIILWYCQVNAIIYVKLDGADADTYKYEPITALLDRWEKIKKDKHGKHCHDQRKKFAVSSFSGHNTREGSPSRAL